MKSTKWYILNILIMTVILNIPQFLKYVTEMPENDNTLQGKVLNTLLYYISASTETFRICTI